MGSLDRLRAELDRVNTRLWRESFGSTKPMAEFAVEVERRFGIGTSPEKDLIAAAVKRFHHSRQVESFRDVRLVCYGIATEVPPEGILLLHDSQAIEELLQIVEGLRYQVRKYRRCFQALMTAYFEYKPEASQDGISATRRSWLEMQAFLRAGVTSIRQEPMPEWAETVIEHRNLFNDDPCERYGREILEGRLSQVRDAFTRIGIAANSWVQADVFMAAVKAACSSSDQQFRGHVDGLLNLLRQNPSMQVPALECILERYARIDSHPDHPALRVFATDLLGNPLLISNLSRWNGVSSEARKMVSDWLKLNLIEQFFELLSHDGATDSRRVKFWAEYVSLIENVWFVLGSAARGNWNPDFKKLRSLMGDQALYLEGATSGNNAFVMKIGGLLLVEFGETGNAAYLFDAQNPPFGLRGALHLRNDLKNSRNLGNLKHVDGHERWERKFRRAITQQTGTKAQATEERSSSDWTRKEPTHQLGGVFAPREFDHLFKAFCADHGLRFVDQRAKGGKLIVYVSADNPKISGTLGQWGFKFDRGSGVWMKYR